MTDEARRDLSIAAALSGELSAEKQREFESACAADPRLSAEYRAAQEMVGRLQGADLHWTEQDLPPALADKVFAATAGLPEAAPERPSAPTELRPRKPRPRVALLSMAAAGLLVIGGLGGAAISADQQAPPTGPPGTLGAVEDVAFSEVPQGSSVEAAVVAHTWGTETVLEIDGLAVGESFEVVLVNEEGQELSSGTFFGSQRTITCRMNAAVMREDVSELLIRTATGEVVVSSPLPKV